MRSRLLVLTVAISGLAVLATTGAPVVAAVDTTPPTLTLPAYATFVVGSQISDTANGEDPL